MTTSENGVRKIAATGLRLMAVVVSTLVMVLLGTATAGATFPGGNGPIVFSSDRGGSQDIYKMDADGTNLVQLTADSGLGDSGNNTDPVWSQDRTMIAFISDREGNPEIYTMDADGNAETRITETAATESDVSFNPDGTKIVYSSNADGDRDLFVMDLSTLGDEDGPTITKLTNNNFEDYNADWSPAGDVIIHERQAGGVSPGRGYQILAISPEGGPTTDLSQTNSVIENGNPSFNGNGTRIAFQRRATSTSNWEIYTMNADGTVQTKRTNTPTANNTSPQFSPSGTNGALDGSTGEKVTFVSDRAGGHQIFTMNHNGATQVKISDGLGDDTDPSWQALDIFPPETTILAGPDEGQVLIVDNASFEFESSEEESTFECRLDTSESNGSWALCDADFSTGSIDDEVYLLHVRAIDPSGNVDPSPATRGFTIDTTPPVVNLTDGPNGPWDGAFINFTDPVIEFSSPENSETNVITFECRLDPVADDPETEDVDESTPWAACDDGSFELSDLSEGEHQIQVRGTDPWTNTSNPVNATFEVDLTLPVSTIDAGPADGLWSSDTLPVWEFSADEPAEFECKLSDTPESEWAACTSPFTPNADLADGAHILRVRATDRALNVQSPPARTLIHIDTVAPVTTIISGPNEQTVNTDQSTFTFSSDQPEDAIYKCQVDSGAAEDCTSPFTTAILDNETHDFRVHSIDRAGNVGAVAHNTFTVYAPPRTIFTGGPADGAYIPTGNAVFEFAGVGMNPSEDAPTFVCRVDSDDAGDWEACTSPLSLTGLNNGQHHVDVQAIGQGNRPDLTPATTTFTVDKVRPETSIVSGPAEGSLTNDPTFQFDSTEDGTFECEINGGSWTACESDVPLAAPDGTVSFLVRAVDLAGNEDLSPVSRSFELDTTPPETTIDSGPADGSQTRVNEPVFEYSSSEPTAATFECAVDDAEWAACDSGEFTSEELADGEHTFKVRATDEAGNTDPSPASSTFTVDTVLPVASILNEDPAEGSLTNDDQPAFQFASDKANSVFECRYVATGDDDAAWESCATGVQPPAALADGEYSFEVRAIDEVGNVQAEPTVRGFTVDTVAPTTEITAGPAEGAVLDTGAVAFEFTSSQEGSTFECSLEVTGDPDDFAACETPFEVADLADGLYTFKVRSTDAAGNVDSSGVTRDFEVDSPPDTSIEASSDVADGGRTKNPTPSFSFSSNETGSTFQCRIDSSDELDWADCTDPHELSLLVDGEHTFEVRAVDDQDRPDLTPAKATFTVDTALPVSAFTAGPADGSFTNQASPEFAFESSKTGSTFVCAIDGGSFDPCDTPITIGPLAEGAHSFAIKAVDDVTNEESPANEVGFTVDLTAPVTTVTVPTEDQSFTTNQPEFEFTADETSSFECAIDDGEAVVCESPFETDELEDGSHTFTVTATDRAGNVETAPVTLNFETEAPPRVTITAGIAEDGLSNQADQAFEFEASETDATFECRIDSSDAVDWEVCESGIELSGLSEGDHTFEVRAVAFAAPHDHSLKPAVRSFSIDTVKPTTEFTAGPDDGDTITTSSTSFEFESNDGGTEFECRVDSDEAGDWAECESPFSLSSLDDGDHVFEVRATDAAGNVQDPVSPISFTVDTTAPVTAITGGPEAGSAIADAAPEFTFTSEPGATFECKVDSGNWEACASPFATASLSDGTHTVSVRATDENGLVETTPPSRTFSVDTKAPEVTIDSGPNGLTNVKAPVFAFSVDEPSSFECQVDQGGFAACDSPFTTASLADGAHTIGVRATDAVGNVSTVATRSFTVDATAPVVTVTKSPAPAAGETSATVEFNASESAAFKCSLDGAAFAACTSPLSLNGLALGSHTVRIQATDTAGNQSETVAAAFEVTAVPPGPGVLGKPVVKSAKKIKAGKTLKLKISVANKGESAITGVKVCVKTQKKLIKGKAKRCKTVSTLGAGRTASVTFPLKTKKVKAAKKRLKLTVSASAAGVSKPKNAIGKVTLIR